MFVMSTVIITGSATLRVLDVSENDIGDEGMAMISEALQHNKSLTTLGVEQCGLSVKGTVASVWIKCISLLIRNLQRKIRESELLNTLYQLI